MILRTWVLALLAGAGVVLSACSSPAPTPHTTTTTTHHVSGTTSSSTTTSTTSGPATSTTAASSACNHISAAAAGSQGAAGTITGTVTISNTGPTTCSMNGYPTMALFSGSGAPLTVTMVNGLSVNLSPAANAAPTTVSLPAGSKAQFAYQYSDVPVGAETSCPVSEMATVTAPGASTASGTFALAIGPCGNGTIRVSPVYPSA